MKKSALFIVCCIALFLTSCASYQKEAPVVAIGGNNINTHIAAEFDYKNARPIEASVKSTLFLGLDLNFNKNNTCVSGNRYKGLSKSESQALYKAIENSDIDIVVEPRFETETHSWFFGIIKTKKVTVKGWGLNITGFKEDNQINDNMPYPASYWWQRFLFK